jgi:hypothetical protein
MTLETITCHCGATVEYQNDMRGAINVARCQKATGWFGMFDCIMQYTIWACPDCYCILLEHAQVIAAVLGTAEVVVSSILPRSK